jgi:hypothetical protein
MKRFPRVLLWALVALLPASCDLPVGSSGVPGLVMPDLTARALKLVSAPGFWDLAAWYCPKVADSPLARLGCAAALGPSPAKDSLAFRFNLPLEVWNPNSFPLPASELLTVLTLFPKQQRISLAAVCVSLCEDEAAGCPPQQGCLSDEPEIRGAQDLAASALDYLSLVLLAGASGEEIPRVAFRTIGPNSGDTLNLTLDLGLDPLEETLKTLFSDGLGKILAGQDFDVAIPTELDGTMWFTADNFGRFGAPFGPVSATFKPR